MLSAKGEIVFTLAGNNYTASDHFRVTFSFGNGMLYSGTIKSKYYEYLEGQTYDVDIDFFTIEDEAFFQLKPILEEKMDTVMCAGSRILGTANLTNFVYDNQPIMISA